MVERPGGSRGRRLFRDGLVLVAAVAAVAVTYAVRLTDNEAHAPATAAAARLDATFADVRAGRATLTATPREVVPDVWAAALTRNTGEVWSVATTLAGTECYAQYFDADGVRHARVLDEDLPCQPTLRVLSLRGTDYLRVGTVEDDPTAAYDWTPVLPDPLRHRYWYLPGVIAAGGVALAASARMVLVGIAGPDVLG